MARMFVRERGHVDEGDRQPRFEIVGVEGATMQFFLVHLRKGELDAIVQATGAELVMLPRGRDEHAGEEGGGGKRKKGKKGGKGGKTKSA